MNAEAKKTAKPTKYLLLKKTGDFQYLIVKRNVEVTGGAHAAFRKEITEPGTYVAVPESNWTEEPLSLEQPPAKLVIGGQPAVQSTVDDQLQAGLDEVDAEVARGSIQTGQERTHSVRV